MNVTTPPHRSPAAFLLLVFGASIPFWLIGPLAERLLPPERAVNLPASAAMAVVPAIVASILVYRERGAAGVRDLLKRVFDYRRIPHKGWLVPALLLMPLIMVAQYGLARWLGKAMPDAQIHLEALPAMLAVFFVSAVGEELGWQGYAYDPLEKRWNALGAALILGTVGALWHTVPFIQAQHDATWIVGQWVWTVASRVLIVLVYKNTGESIFAVLLLHMTSNVSTFLYPNYGSYYYPVLAAGIATAAATVVTLLWGPRTLARLSRR